MPFLVGSFEMRLVWVGLVVLWLKLVDAMQYRNQLYIFQRIAQEMYPTQRAEQKETVATLKYLFRELAWQDRAACKSSHALPFAGLL